MTEKKVKLVAEFHAKLIEYKNAREIMDMYEALVEAAGMDDDALRDA